MAKPLAMPGPQVPSSLPKGSLHFGSYTPQKELSDQELRKLAALRQARDAGPQDPPNIMQVRQCGCFA
jgi:hypothetical protein